MDPQSLFRMIFRYRLLQTCLRNVSISRRHLCVLSSIQLSSQTPIINLILSRDETATFFIVWRTTDGVSFKKVQYRVSYLPKIDPNVIRTHSDEYIFSPSRYYDLNRTVFVGGMSKFTTEQMLYDYFLPFGTITGCKLAREKFVEISERYGFVEFETVGEHPHVIDDQVVGIRLEAINNALDSSPHCIDNKTVDVEQTHARQTQFTIIVKKLSPNPASE
ncbi:RNA recognition motif domain-containing protein [Ditylenchus destructor]|uniref:RNA recognition motif domain-containing protein n=1 Tax=Ditylenchus destructor TaxID=166010 RepID=A0AAD4R326_9BILA|nr:RNA recognition motif domain-containing protein [Ditylenchus destructor]